MFDAAAIGSATRDIFLETDLVKIKRRDLRRGAYLLPVGEKLKAEKMVLTVGGNAVNAAVTFGRQGFRTACIGAVGRDSAGSEIGNFLAKEKIAPLLKINGEEPTAHSVLLLENGERTILSYAGANNDLVLTGGDLEKIKARWWYVSLSGRSIFLFKKILDFAGKNNIAVSFNPTGYHLNRNRKEILANLPRVGLLVLNREEAGKLTGISFRRPEEIFRKLDKVMPGILAITDGRNGAVISDNRFIYEAGIFANKKVVDRTGAGDAFASGLVAGLLRQKIGRAQIGNLPPEKIKEALRLAMANAAVAVEKIGANAGLLTKREFAAPRWQQLPIKLKKI